MVSMKSTKMLCNGNQLIYARVIRSEYLLVVVEKVIFIDEIINTAKNSFSKILEQMGKRHTVR